MVLNLFVGSMTQPNKRDPTRQTMTRGNVIFFLSQVCPSLTHTPLASSHINPSRAFDPISRFQRQPVKLRWTVLVLYGGHAKSWHFGHTLDMFTLGGFCTFCATSVSTSWEFWVIRGHRKWTQSHFTLQQNVILPHCCSVKMCEYKNITECQRQTWASWRLWVGRVNQVQLVTIQITRAGSTN